MYNTIKECFYCGKPRHTEETCYRKHSFPLGFKFRNNSNGSSINNACVENVVSSVEANAMQGGLENSGFNFTLEQYQRLLALFQLDKQESHSTNQISTVIDQNSLHLTISSLNSSGDSYIFSCSLKV